MLWSRKQPLVGIDIGTHSIKLLQLKRAGKGYQLLHFGLMPLAAGAIVDGVIRQPDVVVEAIRNLVRMENIRTKDVVTAVSGQSVIVKRVRMPRMNRKEIAENLQWEAEQHIPFEIADVNIDFQELPQAGVMRRSGLFSGLWNTTASDQGGDDQIDVLLVAARKAKIEDYTGLLLEAGLHPVVVDTDVFALENSYELNYAIDADQVIALVDIGASTMNINILKENITLFQRDIAIGGNRYTAAIEQEFRVSYQQAEALKMGVGFSPTLQKDRVLSLMIGVSEAIGEEIQRSLEFFRSSIAEEDITKMVISGGCARIKGLDRFLSHRLELPVEIADPFRNIQCSEKTFDPDYLRDMAPVAAVGIGLALREMDDQ